MHSMVIEKFLDYFKTPTAQALINRELEEAKRRLLEAQSARDYADAMCKYHESRIKRLSQ
jgi:hypothetical protein